MLDKIEEITWGKTHDYYKPQFKERGIELKVELLRRGYRKVNMGGRGGLDDFNDFKIYLNNKIELQFHGISFDILDCILMSYLYGFDLAYNQEKEFKEDIKQDPIFEQSKLEELI